MGCVEGGTAPEWHSAQAVSCGCGKAGGFPWQEVQASVAAAVQAGVAEILTDDYATDDYATSQPGAQQCVHGELPDNRFVVGWLPGRDQRDSG